MQEDLKFKSRGCLPGFGRQARMVFTSLFGICNPEPRILSSFATRTDLSIAFVMLFSIAIK